MLKSAEVAVWAVGHTKDTQMQLCSVCAVKGDVVGVEKRHSVGVSYPLLLRCREACVGDEHVHEAADVAHAQHGKKEAQMSQAEQTDAQMQPCDEGAREHARPLQPAQAVQETGRDVQSNCAAASSRVQHSQQRRSRKACVEGRGNMRPTQNARRPPRRSRMRLCAAHAGVSHEGTECGNSFVLFLRRMESALVRSNNVSCSLFSHSGMRS